jgi:hypothetical protein
MTMTVTLRRVNEHRLVIEGPFGGTRGYVRATPSGRLILENRSGRRVGSVRALPDGERGHRRVPPGAWLLGIARLNLLFESHSLRQDALSGHSFSASDQWLKSRRLRPFLANCPNHGARPEGPRWPVSVSLGPLSPRQPNHGHFGTDVESR